MTLPLTFFCFSLLLFACDIAAIPWKENKNRLCSKTCGIDNINIVKKSKEKNYSEIQSELFYYDWQLKQTGSHPKEKT